MCSCPESTAVAPQAAKGQRTGRLGPCRMPEVYGGWCMTTTLNGALDASIFDLIHCAYFEVLLVPSGSRLSLETMKKWIDPLRTS